MNFQSQPTAPPTEMTEANAFAILYQNMWDHPVPPDLEQAAYLKLREVYLERPIHYVRCNTKLLQVYSRIVSKEHNEFEAK